MNTLMKDVKIASTIKAFNLNLKFRESLDKGVKFEADKHKVYTELDFDASTLPQEMKDRLLVHGLKQKLVDNLAYTKETKEKTTVFAAARATKELWNQLMSGRWEAEGKGGKPRKPSITYDALVTSFMEGVAKGITTFDSADQIYFGITGKHLPEPEPEVEETEEN